MIMAYNLDRDRVDIFHENFEVTFRKVIMPQLSALIAGTSVHMICNDKLVTSASFSLQIGLKPVKHFRAFLHLVLSFVFVLEVLGIQSKHRE